MTNWYLTKKSYRGWRREASTLCVAMFGPEDNSGPQCDSFGRWAFDIADGRLAFRSKEDLLMFVLRFNPYIDPKYDF